MAGSFHPEIFSAGNHPKLLQVLSNRAATCGSVVAAVGLPYNFLQALLENSPFGWRPSQIAVEAASGRVNDFFSVYYITSYELTFLQA